MSELELYRDCSLHQSVFQCSTVPGSAEHPWSVPLHGMPQWHRDRHVLGVSRHQLGADVGNKIRSNINYYNYYVSDLISVSL